MKSLLIFLSILILICPRICAQTTFTCNNSPCGSVGDPIIMAAYADMEKYLSRTLELNALTKENTDYKVGQQYTDPPTNTILNPCFSPTCLDDNDASYKCLGGIAYCPNKYCEDIGLAVTLNATMLLHVAIFWDNLDGFVNPDDPTNPHWAADYVAAKQAVIDINHAYDCAGLRRPIIGAAIVEHVDGEINGELIPNDILTAFFN